MAILIGIGANLPALGYSSALDTCRAALNRLQSLKIEIEAVSEWYETAPVPVSDQPWFVNAVFSIARGPSNSAHELLEILHRVENDFGRIRVEKNEARVLDLDLLDYDGKTSKPDDWPVLPHPRIAERLFVAVPLRDLVPDWQHPTDGKTIDAIIRDLEHSGQRIRSLAESAPID